MFSENSLATGSSDSGLCLDVIPATLSVKLIKPSTHLKTNMWHYFMSLKLTVMSG